MVNTSWSWVDRFLNDSASQKAVEDKMHHKNLLFKVLTLSSQGDIIA
jgi:hypothetical protein